MNIDFKMKYAVGLIGSSGGGCATFASGESLVSSIRVQLQGISRRSSSSTPMTNPELPVASPDDLVKASNEILSGEPSPPLTTNLHRNRRSSVNYSSKQRRSSLLNMFGVLTGEENDMLVEVSETETPRNSLQMPLSVKNVGLSYANDDRVVDIDFCSFVTSDTGLDSHSLDSSARLWILNDQKQCICQKSGTLADVNFEATIVDGLVAEKILAGEIHALIVVSCDPLFVNKASVNAAIRKNIPLVGTGGSSVSHISCHGGNIIGSSGGSVATSESSKSISFAASLASYWSLEYTVIQKRKANIISSAAGASWPVVLTVVILSIILRSLLILVERQLTGSSLTCVSSLTPIPGQTAGIDSINGPVSKGVTKAMKVVRSGGMWLKSILVNKFTGKVADQGSTVIPSELSRQNCSASFGFLLRILSHVSSQLTSLLGVLQSRVVNVAVSAVVASQTSGLGGEVGMLAGATAGSMIGSESNVLAALLAGRICGLMLPAALAWCSKSALPPSASSIVSVGVSVASGGFSAFVMAAACTSCLTYFNSDTSTVTEFLVQVLPGLPVATVAVAMKSLWWRGFVGGVLGWLVSWGSEAGYYHSVMLPLIVQQMGAGDLALLGGFDLCCLCMPCAGVCAAVWCLSHADLPSDENSLSQTTIHRRVAVRGFLSNFLYGDFVEACYPYTQRYHWLLIAVRVSCAMSGAMLYTCSIRSSAYLPLPVAVFLTYLNSSDIHSALTLFCCCLLCFVGPFVVSLIVIDKKSLIS